MELSLRAWYHVLLLVSNGLPPKPPFGLLLPVKAISVLTTTPLSGIRVLRAASDSHLVCCPDLTSVTLILCQCLLQDVRA